MYLGKLPVPFPETCDMGQVEGPAGLHMVGKDTCLNEGDSD